MSWNFKIFSLFHKIINLPICQSEQHDIILCIMYAFNFQENGITGQTFTYNESYNLLTSFGSALIKKVTWYENNVNLTWNRKATAYFLLETFTRIFMPFIYVFLTFPSLINYYILVIFRVTKSLMLSVLCFPIRQRTY